MPNICVLSRGLERTTSKNKAGDCRWSLCKRIGDQDYGARVASRFLNVAKEDIADRNVGHSWLSGPLQQSYRADLTLGLQTPCPAALFNVDNLLQYMLAKASHADTVMASCCACRSLPPASSVGALIHHAQATMAGKDLSPT